jgi:hypothetical protein
VNNILRPLLLNDTIVVHLGDRPVVVAVGETVWVDAAGLEALELQTVLFGLQSSGLCFAGAATALADAEPETEGQKDGSEAGAARVDGGFGGAGEFLPFFGHGFLVDWEEGFLYSRVTAKGSVSI